MVQFNPATTPQIEQGNSEGLALRSECEEVGMPLDAETISNPPIAALHKATQDVVGGIVPGLAS
jgi:hypothetical protein